MTKRKKLGYSLFQRQSGDWVLTFKSDEGSPWKQHRLGQMANKAQAIKAADAWLATSVANGSLPSATRTVEEAAGMWLRQRAAHPDLAGSTVQDNKSHLEQHIIPKFGKTPLHKLDALQIREWVRELRSACAPSTLRNIINTFSAFYEDARAERWVKSPENVVRDPAVRREMPSVSLQRDEVVVVSVGDAQRLMTFDAVPMHRRVRYALAFLTGLRDGEIAGLTWGDIDIDALMPVLHVRRAHAFKATPGQHAGLSRTKTEGSVRVIPLHTAVQAALVDWKRNGCPLWLDHPIRDTSPVFPSPRTGGHWRPRSADELRADLSAVGLQSTTQRGTPVDFHATRRSLSTWLADLGVEETTRDRILGHAAKSTNGRHYTGEILQRMAHAIGLVNLRWSHTSSSLSAPTGPTRPHDADLVRPHNEDAEDASQAIDITDEAPVAQWIEQRFPNSSLGASQLAEVAQEAVTSDRDGAQGSGHLAALVRSDARARTMFERREPHEERVRRLRDEADAMVSRVVDGVAAGTMPREAVDEALSDAVGLLRARELKKAAASLSAEWDVLERMIAEEETGT